MKLVEFNSVSHEQWDEYVNRIPEATYLHTWWWIDYLNAINGKGGAKSFLLLEDNEPVAICPLGICQVNNEGKEYREATFGGIQNPYPAIIQLPATQRRRIVRKIFTLIHEILKPYDVKRIEFYKHPITLSVLNGNFDLANIAEAISFGYLCYLQNTIVVDLKKEEDELFYEVARYQRKHVKKSKKQGLTVNEYSGDAENLNKVFGDFQSAHFKSAGKLTRPIESWDIMKELLKLNKATLFTASVDNAKNISYLYCGEFDKFGFGWSQVNIDEYEKEYSPRHFLEWEAMMSYKRRGFRYYEVGIKHDVPQFNHIPTNKEVTISQFKERYGGKLYCNFYFERFFDKDLFDVVYKCRLERFLSSNYFSLSKEKAELQKVAE